MKQGESWEHAPTIKGFNKLVEAAERTDKVYENKFLLYLAGELGFRSGEIAHIKLSWFNFDEGVIYIPPHEPCNCAYCSYCAKKRTKNPNLTPQEVRNIYWQPKTDAGRRVVPYKLKDDVPEVLERVIKKYGRYPRVVKTSEYNIHRLVKLAGGIQSAFGKNIYLHGLRAYAVTQYAYADFSLWDICNVMGWKDIKTASKYLARLGVNAKKMNKKKDDNKTDFLFNEPSRLLTLNKTQKQETCKELSFEENVWLNRFIKD